MCADSRRKTSFEIDSEKVQAAKAILGTSTTTETVDAALAEVVKLKKRREFLDLLATPGVLDVDRPEVMSRAWR